MKHINIPEYQAMATVADDCPQETIIALKEVCRIAYYGLKKQPLSKKMMISKAEKIIEIVKEYYNLEQDAMFSLSRKRTIVDARQIAMYFIKKYTGLSLQGIGELFPKHFDHTTVIHSITQVKNQLSSVGKNYIQIDVEEIEKRIYSL